MVRSVTRLAAVLITSVAVGVSGIQHPAVAAGCSYTLTADGFPFWSGCSTTVAPGRFGPLEMGVTTVQQAKNRNYLAYNRFCARWDGVAAFRDWRKKDGRVVAWRGGTRTTKGLRPGASLAKARQLYPNLTRTGFMANAYVAGQGWRIYSTRTKYGWLDIYRYNTATSTNGNFFAVRARSVTKPITSWSQDGC